MTEAFAARAGRAAEIVRRGGVETFDGGRYRVRSTPESGGFAVREGYCNCPDFAWRGAVPCKHLIAVAMARALAPRDA
jgi:predicted nucleic acid-binding Zn finger protein